MHLPRIFHCLLTATIQTGTIYITTVLANRCNCISIKMNRRKKVFAFKSQKHSQFLIIQLSSLSLSHISCKKSPFIPSVWYRGLQVQCNYGMTSWQWARVRWSVLQANIPTFSLFAKFAPRNEGRGTDVHVRIQLGCTQGRFQTDGNHHDIKSWFFWAAGMLAWLSLNNVNKKFICIKRWWDDATDFKQCRSPAFRKL